jgi:hypothetical protein
MMTNTPQQPQDTRKTPLLDQIRERIAECESDLSRNELLEVYIDLHTPSDIVSWMEDTVEAQRPDGKYVIALNEDELTMLKEDEATLAELKQEVANMDNNDLVQQFEWEIQYRGGDQVARAYLQAVANVNAR